MLNSPAFHALQSRMSALAALIAPAFPWDKVTPGDVAVGLYLLDWKLTAFGHAPAISNAWTRNNLGLPIAPEGDEGLALAAVLDGLTSDGAVNFSANPDLFPKIVLDLADLLRLEFQTYRARQDLQLRFYATTPVYSSPERAPMDLAYYAQHLADAPLHRPEAARARRIAADRLKLAARKLIGPKRPPARY